MPPLTRATNPTSLFTPWTFAACKLRPWAQIARPPQTTWKQFLRRARTPTNNRSALDSFWPRCLIRRGPEAARAERVEAERVLAEAAAEQVEPVAQEAELAVAGGQAGLAGTGPGGRGGRGGQEK